MVAQSGRLSSLQLARGHFQVAPGRWEVLNVQPCCTVFPWIQHWSTAQPNQLFLPIYILRIQPCKLMKPRGSIQGKYGILKLISC